MNVRTFTAAQVLRRPRKALWRSVYSAALAALLVCPSCTVLVDFPARDDGGTQECGNGVLQPDEECDDGNMQINDGCSAACEQEEGWNCSGNPSVCQTICGDGLVRGDEQCDDGNTQSLDGCSATCTNELIPGCGDGFLAGQEECDDHNTNNDDGCSALCKIEDGWSCQRIPSTCTTVCGDGMIKGSEECDDGNTWGNDGCNAFCAEEQGWQCQGIPSDCDPVCGDGLVRGDEQCDDGNTAPGDGCSAVCTVECSNGSTTDCNAAGQTLNAAAAFVDPSPPQGFIQCAGFRNTPLDDVDSGWELNCLGAEQTLRIRYWDTSTDPWILMGDATLSPASAAGYSTQTFDATSHGGTEGVLENQGVVLLKDALAAAPVSYHQCSPGGANEDYGANDLMLANIVNNRTLFVCSVHEVSGDRLCWPESEISITSEALYACAATHRDATELAVAVYHMK